MNGLMMRTKPSLSTAVRAFGDDAMLNVTVMVILILVVVTAVAMAIVMLLGVRCAGR